MAFKSFETRAFWFANEADIELRIRKRIIPTEDGKSSLFHFDGATMMSYLYPSRPSELVFCRRDPVPAGCNGGRGFELDRLTIPLSSLEVKASNLGEQAGRGVFATMDIPENSYIGLDKLVHTFYMSPSTYDVVTKMRQHYGSLYSKAVDTYSHSYGQFTNYHVSHN